MAKVAAIELTFNGPNFVGPLFNITPTETKTLSMIGGLTGGTPTYGTEFSWQTEVLAAAAQPSIIENAALVNEFYDRAEVFNTTQPFVYAVEVSYEKMAATQALGIPGTDAVSRTQGTQPVTNELQHQTMLKLKQMALDVNYTLINGTYANPTSNTARKTRGLLVAITSNTTAAAGATLDKALVDGMLLEAWTNGAPLPEDRTVILVNGFQKQKISEVYGIAPRDRNIGGLDIDTIETDFGRFGVALERHMPTDTVLLADFSVLDTRHLVVPDKGVVFYESVATATPSEQGMLWGHIGLEYGPEVNHAKITGLATS